MASLEGISEFLPVDPETLRQREVFPDFLRGLTIAYSSKEDAVRYAKHLVSAAGKDTFLLAIVEKILAETIRVSKEKGINFLPDVFTDTDDLLKVPYPRDFEDEAAYQAGLDRWRSGIFQLFVDKYKEGSTTPPDERVPRSDLVVAFGLIGGLDEKPESFSPLSYTNATALRQAALSYLGMPQPVPPSSGH